MVTDRFTGYMVTVALVALIAWLPALPTRAVDQPSGVATPSTSTGGLGVVASGAVEDTLQSCLARIPTDASAGQRMIAVQSCERDEATRKSIQAVPGR